MKCEFVEEYIRNQYGVEPDYPWDNDDSAVYRHIDSRKWFALVMFVRRDRLGLEGEDITPALNLKIKDPILHDMLVHEEGIIPAYHMNKQHWITVLLDGTVEQSKIFNLIDVSYEATGK